MDFKQIQHLWFDSKQGIIEEKDLIPLSYMRTETGKYVCYECPCGGKDHVATRREIAEGHSTQLSTILNCYETRKQWLVRPVDVVGVIRSEEEIYLKLLEKSPAIVKKVVAQRGLSIETMAFLKDTHGIDSEIVEMVCSLHDQALT